VQRKRKPRRKAVTQGTRGLSPLEVGNASPEGEALAQAIRADGGAALATYRDPLGGHAVVLASLPIDKVEPTPYQRDLSQAHVKRLATAMERVDRYLDPLIAVRKDGRYWTPNGNHRLGASRLLGAKAVVALVLPEEDVAFHILALNTEKAHNLRERALEVVRMYHDLLPITEGTEASLEALFEEPSFITLGLAYEARPRFSGGAYQSVLKRVDTFLDEDLALALSVRQARADLLLALDEKVTRAVDALKARGLESPYLRAYVVARINNLRFRKTVPEFEPALEEMIAAAERFDPTRIRREDLSRASGPPEEEAG
jgi:ParB family chromosome partitioning protein